MNSGYEGSLPEASGNRIAIITFFIANVVSFYSIAVTQSNVFQGRREIDPRKEMGRFGRHSDCPPNQLVLIKIMFIHDKNFLYHHHRFHNCFHAREKDKWKQGKKRSWVGRCSGRLERPCFLLVGKSPKGV